MRIKLKSMIVMVVAAAGCIAVGGRSAEVNVGDSSEASGEEIADEVRGGYLDRAGRFDYVVEGEGPAAGAA